MILTLPHMYETHPKYTSLIRGQNPSYEKHQIYMDVEAVSLCN